MAAQTLASAFVAAPRPSVARRPASAAALRAAAFRPAAAARRHAAVAVRAQAAAVTTAQGVEQTTTRGLPAVTLKHESGATVEVTLFGGCVTSWKTSAGQEVLYIRPDAVFDKSKPISGGMPHCFPQFGPGAIQLHGFARNLDWQLAGAANNGGNPSVTLVLSDNDYTRAMWPHAFKAEYTVTLDDEVLRTKLTVTNNGDKPFEFTASLHSYFGVDDVETANVRGLEGLEYLDRVADSKHPSVHKELRELVTFRGPVDSVYKNAPAKVALDNGRGAVAMSSSNWPEIVVWTPWTAMEACYKEFVCVENAQATSPVTLAPGATWAASTAFKASRDPLLDFCADNPDSEECRVYDD
ncbi:glucose-6-phosphate 1-epimerase [Micractinium conductrix]|uniref:glucose-6-phosphate 1-epimerase n=1 Tax=Micractinium conductrix TaxID=554055 RepID=A0A2P6VG57_9CHLO|nr:glucose-6-phosphate 1-epimerase [Micractinium conductrix]|eukprot:PSC73084.1 glucose-6-phosphate 1-epimerase [Micractinium conductrix]